MKALEVRLAEIAAERDRARALAEVAGREVEQLRATSAAAEVKRAADDAERGALISSLREERDALAARIGRYKEVLDGVPQLREALERAGVAREERSFLEEVEALISERDEAWRALEELRSQIAARTDRGGAR